MQLNVKTGLLLLAILFFLLAAFRVDVSVGAEPRRRSIDFVALGFAAVVAAFLFGGG